MSLKWLHQDLLEQPNNQQIKITNPDGVVTLLYPCRCEKQCNTVHITIHDKDGDLQLDTWIYDDEDMEFIDKVFGIENSTEWSLIDVYQNIKLMPSTQELVN